jgi:hypothetical protein
VQQYTDKYVAQIDSILELKEKEIMTVWERQVKNNHKRGSKASFFA